MLFPAAKQRVTLCSDLQWSDDANPSTWHQTQAASTVTLGITLCLASLHPICCELATSSSLSRAQNIWNKYSQMAYFISSIYFFLLKLFRFQPGKLESNVDKWGPGRLLTLKYPTWLKDEHNSPWNCKGKLLISNIITCKDKVNLKKKTPKIAKSECLLVFADGQMSNWHKCFFF